MSHIRIVLVVTGVIIVGFYVSIITAAPLFDNGCGGGCYRSGYEGVYFFGKPVSLTAVGQENRRIDADDRITACFQVCTSQTRLDIGWAIVYISAVILLVVVAFYRRRKRNISSL